LCPARIPIDEYPSAFLEISDEPWCPRGIRRGVTDFCRFVTEHSGLFNAVAPLLGDAIRKTGAHRILDMG
jgi:hypothetical protein